MANPGVGGALGSASDVSFLTVRATDDILYFQDGYWRNYNVNERFAMSIRGGQEKVSAHTLSANMALDLANGNIFNVTVAASAQLSFSGAVSGKGCSFTLYLRQNATGGFAVTWGSTIKWSGGAPTLTTTANAVDILVFESIDGGTTWFGSLVGTDFK